jgi:hypothetical protein
MSEKRKQKSLMTFYFTAIGTLLTPLAFENELNFSVKKVTAPLQFSVMNTGK